jgi:UDP-N-acetylmuramyl pentapeptide phosphotransferase/UDP-N-acetylglucosamine-1-phosphate transferase
MVMSMPHAHQADTERRGGVIVLILSCVLAALIALFAPRLALWALLLNALPVFSFPCRRTERRA